MENSPASSRDPSMDSTLTDGLTSNTGMGINILQKKKRAQNLKLYSLEVYVSLRYTFTNRNLTFSVPRKYIIKYIALSDGRNMVFRNLT